MDHAAILAGQPDGLATGLVDEVDHVLVDLSAQHHFDDFHRLRVSDAHALDELPLLADAGQQVFDLRAAAMDDDDIHADEFEQHDIAGKTLLEFLVDHRVAAELDDDRFAVEALDVGKCFSEDGRFLGRGNLRGGHGRAPYDDRADFTRHNPKYKGKCGSRSARYEFGFQPGTAMHARVPIDVGA